MTTLKITHDNAETASLLMEILIEVERAEKKHPAWPTCHVKQIAIVSEESGELTREGNLLDEGKGSFRDIRTEAIQTAAVAIRFLMNLAETEKNYKEPNIIDYVDQGEVSNG